ncbi:MAG TPA: nuclear transport factor 2 family protein [Acidimicrobiales bacterium]|nr:nuclear transport factor 2 family protein [Acidimicrobiales bacterium]
MLRNRVATRMVRRSLEALNRGDVGPTLRMDAPDVHFRFPGSSSWAADVTGRDLVEAWLRRMVATGLQHQAEAVVASGPPWRMTMVLRGTDTLPGPDGATAYENRYVIWATARWGRIRDYEVYEDTEKLTALDTFLGVGGA